MEKVKPVVNFVYLCFNFLHVWVQSYILVLVGHYQTVHPPPTSHFYVPTCQRAEAMTIIQLGLPVYQRCANVSTWGAQVPKGVPIFQTFLLRNAKGNFYTLLLYKIFYILLDIIVIHTIWYIWYAIFIPHVMLK